MEFHEDFLGGSVLSQNGRKYQGTTEENLEGMTDLCHVPMNPLYPVGTTEALCATPALEGAVSGDSSGLKT